MKILDPRQYFYCIFVLINLLNPLDSIAYSKISNTDFLDKENNKLNLKNNISSPNLVKNENSEIFFDKDQELVLNESINDEKALEIQSDNQYQENGIIYAEGNVLVTFKGNSLIADSLVYDQINEKFDASGNIKLILGQQAFKAERIKYDFKSQKGKLLKVKGLIKTKNLVDNIDLSSDDNGEPSSVFQEIRKIKVLYTPDGINNWIFSTDELIVENKQWMAKKAVFTNDLLDSNQVKFEINNLKIIPKENQLKIQSSISFLVLEDKVPIPFWFGNRTVNYKDSSFFEFNSKWYLGTDNADKDGYFIGRKFNPINISDDFSLVIEPQILIERSIKGYTKSFVDKGESITADKSTRDTSFADYFALNSELNGKVNNWDLKIETNLYSFDSDKFLDASRLQINLSKEIELLKSKWDKTFYGVYRDRVWNGSIGESEIYIGYGSKLAKQNTWEINGIRKTERITVGLGNFKGEELNSEKLANSYKGSIFYSLDQKFPVRLKESENKSIDNSFHYIFEPVNQGIYIDTSFAAFYSFYKNGNHQEYIGFGAGPEFIFGEFKKKYFDYTRIRLFPFYRLKSGDSIFKFDQIADKFTLNLALDQQLYGPILLKADATLNLDGNSKDYGDFINSKISLNWKKRSYELGIFYQPHNQAGGINFTLFGFE